jgi:amino acid permease
LALCFGISVAALVFYLLDNNYSDKTLLFLLTIIRYSSFIVFICSFYKIAVNIYRCFRDRKFRPFRLIFYLVIIAYSVIIILMDAFIIALSGGNG